MLKYNLKCPQTALIMVYGINIWTVCSLEQIIQEDAQQNKNKSPTLSTNVACRRLHSEGLCDIAHHTVVVSQANVSHECKCQESTHNPLKRGSAFATTMIWREARVV